MVTSSFVDNVKDWLPSDVENVDNNRVIKAHVFAEVELKSARRLAIALAMLTVLGEVFKCFFVDSLAGTF